MNELALLDTLVNCDWQSVQALNFPNASIKNTYYDIAFITEKGKISLKGEAHQDQSGYDNSFSLLIREHCEGELWEQAKIDNKAWFIDDFGQKWQNTPFQVLLKAPRNLTFKHDPLINTRAYSCETFFDNFSSLEFSKLTDDGQLVKIVIEASIEDPCCIIVNTFSGNPRANE